MRDGVDQAILFEGVPTLFDHYCVSRLIGETDNADKAS